MSDLMFWGWNDASAEFGNVFSPDPVTTADTSWTWDVEFATTPEQATYAKTAMTSFSNQWGVGYYFSGVVSYTTRDSSGIDHVQSVGQGTRDGVATAIADNGVVSVTFGFGVGAQDIGSGIHHALDVVYGDCTFEIWRM